MDENPERNQMVANMVEGVLLIERVFGGRSRLPADGDAAEAWIECLAFLGGGDEGDAWRAIAAFYDENPPAEDTADAKMWRRVRAALAAREELFSHEADKLSEGLASAPLNSLRSALVWGDPVETVGQEIGENPVTWRNHFRAWKSRR